MVRSAYRFRGTEANKREDAMKKKANKAKKTKKVEIRDLKPKKADAKGKDVKGGAQSSGKVVIWVER